MDAESVWIELPDGGRHALAGVCTIGRKASNHIVLPDATVSGAHAVVQRSGSRTWTITDLRSTNGTYIRGHKISTPVELTDGAQVRIGPFALVFHQPGREEPAGTRTMPMPGTVVQTYAGPCWLLLLDLENFTARRQTLGENRTAALMRAWTVETRSIVEANGGTLNSQPGDALLFYWRDDQTPGVVAAVDTTLRALIALQQRPAELTYRVVLHRGPAQLSIGELRVEQLAGPEVDFLFRLEKLAKPLGARCLLSEAAAMALDVTQQTRDLGEHVVPSFVGRHRLRAFGVAPAAVIDAKPASAVATPPPAARPVLVVAPSGAAADGLIRLIAGEADLMVVGHASTAHETRRMRSSCRPHLVVLDLSLNDGDPLTLIRDLQTADEKPSVLVLAGAQHAPLVERSLKSGAVAAVLSNDPTHELLLAIRTALGGNVYLSRRLAAVTLRALAGSDDGGRRSGPASLSDRELEIFHLIAGGRQNREIAQALSVSVKTVETHKENIKTKLGLKSTAELADAASHWMKSSLSRPPF